VFKVSLAIFFTFASFGFVTDLFHPLSKPPVSLILGCIFSGVSAAAFLLVTMRRPRFLVLLIPAVIAAAIGLTKLPEYQNTVAISSELQHRLILDAVMIQLLINLGYWVFINFIETEGFRHLRYQTEVELAEDLQSTLVPPLSLRTEHIEIVGRSLPSSNMGGDLADALQSEDTITCYIADVSGHGIAAGVLMGMVKTAVRMAALRGEMLDSILQSVHRVLPGVKPPNAYVTVAGLRFHGQSVAEYATAGHLPILHYRRTTGAVERLSLEQFPVGMIPTAEYCAAEVTYASGDIFVLLTDGIVEVADSRDREFGLERVEQLLSENAASPLGDLADVITSAAGAHGARTDDQTVLLARIAG
jgi:hypothetical protein